MCGITGIFHYRDQQRSVDKLTLHRMTQSLAHRGPDGSGLYLDGPLGLGHRRLAIVDLTPTGAQPMRSADAQFALSYNGEIYNHAELRKTLRATDAEFRGTSDTETLLHLLWERGTQSLPDLIGIFGFAFWDVSKRQLLLVRDPLGVKQVYYHDNGQRIVFSSEIKALLQCDDVPRDIDPEGFNQYVHFHSPLFDRTFFRGIRQLKPGEFLTIDEHGIRSQTYWEVNEFSTTEQTPEEAVAHLSQLLGKVVGDQLMSDVPVGAFFSGGIDSSAVASFATKHGKRPLLFGAHFTGQGVIDERPYQEDAARSLGLELHLTTVDPQRFPYDLPKLLHSQDCPVIGPALLPMHQVSQLARKHVTVCLGGQGADEIFGGYARYGLTQPWRTGLSLLKSKLWGGRQPHAEGAPEGAAVGGNLWKQLTDIRNLRRLMGTVQNTFNWQANYFSNFALVPEGLWHQLLADRSMVSRQRCYDVFRERVAKSNAPDPATKALHWDIQAWLPGLFHQDDRMSMANSLESRVPLADPRLVKFAFQCDFGLKIRNGASKWMLRQAVADVLPENVLNRRKVGFDTPTKSWMQGMHFDFVRDTLSSQAARERGWWNQAGVTKLLESPSHLFWHDAVWKTLCTEVWAQQFLDSKPLQMTHGLHDSPTHVRAA